MAEIRVAARLANAFALDIAKLGGFGRDVIDGLLLAAISQANVSQITRSPELQRQYATLEAVPPDDLRRPVSINAVAASLHIPFETARRRVSALAKAGVIKITPRGVIVPQGPLNSPFYRIAVDANYRLVRDLYLRLRAMEVFKDLPRAPAAFDHNDPPVRLVVRLSSDYVLRLAEPVTQNVGDLVTGLIFMDVIHANTEHFGDREHAEYEGPIPDELRRPIRASSLSERLGIPAETVRRHLNRLIETDRVERVADGYLAPARVLSRQPFGRYVLDNQVHLQRLMEGLAEYGIIAAWDREAETLVGAA